MTMTVKANGAEIPAMGFGTWELRGATAIHCVQAALDAGYRHIDTAAMYANESEVGEAIASHATPRKAIFVTTKVWATEAGDGPLQRSAEASLKRLGLDIIDLLLIHWPSTSVSLKAQIFALCDSKRRGLTRHIGISNFSPRQVEEAVAVADEPIVTNQIEHHPWRDQSALFKACAKHGISITSYSPLGKARNLDDPVVAEIARAHGKDAGADRAPLAHPAADEHRHPALLEAEAHRGEYRRLRLRAHGGGDAPHLGLVPMSRASARADRALLRLIQSRPPMS